MGTGRHGMRAGRGGGGEDAQDGSSPARRPRRGALSQKELADYLGGEIGAHGGGSRGAPALRGLKSYVLEANTSIARSGGPDGAGWEMEDAGIKRVKILRVRAGGASCKFYADIADGRFHVLHTAIRSDVAERALASIAAADRPWLDRAWLPDPLLRALARRAGAGALRGFAAGRAGGFLGTGRSSSEGLDLDARGPLAGEAYRHASRNRKLAGAMAYRRIALVRGDEDRPPCHVCDDISRDGCLAVRRGGSMVDHLHLVDEARMLYAGVVGGIEKCRLGWSGRGTRKVFEGSPVHIEFGDPLRDVGGFIDKLFDSTRPLRLWGLKSELEEGYYSVAGMDIHTGDLMNFEIAADMMRVYLPQMSRGSTVMRLLCNLQDIFGATVRCRKVEELAR